MHEVILRLRDGRHFTLHFRAKGYGLVVDSGALSAIVALDERRISRHQVFGVGVVAPFVRFVRAVIVAHGCAIPVIVVVILGDVANEAAHHIAALTLLIWPVAAFANVVTSMTTSIAMCCPATRPAAPGMVNV